MTKPEIRKIALTCISLLSLIAFFVFWQMIIEFKIVPNNLLASPVQVIKLFFVKLTAVDPEGATLIRHTIVSLEEALLGYVCALIIGIPLGLAMGWFKVVDGLARPIFEMIRPIPPVAWIPLAIFWFGIGLTSKAFIIFFAALVASVINSYTGVRLTNPTFIRMARAYGASNWEIFWQVCIPSALPMVFGGLQVALAGAWTSLVAAELVAADSGLGYLINVGRRLMRVDLVVLGMFMVGLTGVLIAFIVNRIERRLVAGVRR
ncbi:ABC transporter permease [Desulfosporosinus sp. PR]|uniref:ABC transporter permease n=1 Tax=Candidatus Desulfosporosinus nitrosoreducens TaxID=3401928 RepID=UPI0027F15530|nr:ABC transporter permease [Desulfosporosinus sp. PR]MDQ7095168.1 ABC transporter permease [Desulfosporosinus sp. PR]